MPSSRATVANKNILLRMYPLERVLVSLFLAIAGFFILPKSTGILVTMMCVWIVFAASFLIFSWIILFKRPVEDIKKVAAKQDGSNFFVFLMVLLSAFASMFTVLLLMISQESETLDPAVFLPVAITGMLLSWMMVHTVFTFHYAHMFYDVGGRGTGKISGGLNFPGEKEPDYIDFAYFSFVIGCTFQVSDVGIVSRKIRRTALLHSLLSFGLNTFVVALTINFVAGLKK